MHKSKNCYFYHILVSPGGAHGAIMLNVAWIERQFDAYKLSSCMCSSNYNCFWDTARYWSKIVIFHTPLHSAPPLGGLPSENRHPVCCGETRMVWLPDGEQIFKISLFILAQLTNVIDRRTDRRTDTACWHRPSLCIASHSKNELPMKRLLEHGRAKSPQNKDRRCVRHLFRWTCWHR